MKKYIIINPIRKNKKYSVLVYDPIEKKYKYFLSFGDKRYQHFKDQTPLKLYSHLDHNDINRKKRYYSRHGITNDINSALWWSNNFLW